MQWWREAEIQSWYRTVVSWLGKISRVPTIDSMVFNFFEDNCLLSLTSPEFQGFTPLSLPLPCLPGEVLDTQAFFWQRSLSKSQWRARFPLGSEMGVSSPILLLQGLRNCGRLKLRLPVNSVANTSFCQFCGKGGAYKRLVCRTMETRKTHILPKPFLSISGKWARLKSIIRWVTFVEISWMGLRWISWNVYIKLTMKQLSPPVNVWLQKNYHSTSRSVSSFLLRKLGEVPLGFRGQEFAVSENSKWGANLGWVLEVLGEW